MNLFFDWLCLVISTIALVVSVRVAWQTRQEYRYKPSKKLKQSKTSTISLYSTPQPKYHELTCSPVVATVTWASSKNWGNKSVDTRIAVPGAPKEIFFRSVLLGNKLTDILSYNQKLLVRLVTTGDRGNPLAVYQVLDWDYSVRRNR